MLKVEDTRTVRCDEGWAVYQTGHDELAYEEEGKGRMKFGVTIGGAPGLKTMVVLSHATWKWDRSDVPDVTDVGQRRIVIQRIVEGLVALGYRVDTYTLEVLSGIRSHAMAAVPLGGGRVRWGSGDRTVTVTLRKVGADRAVVELSQLQHWDPPHGGVRLDLVEMQEVITDLAALAKQYGLTLVVLKENDGSQASE